MRRRRRFIRSETWQSSDDNAGFSYAESSSVIAIRLGRPARIHVERIKRSLSANIQAVTARAAKTDIGDELSDRNRADMRPVLGKTEHVLACGRPDVAENIATKAIE